MTVTGGKADVTNENTIIPLPIIWAWDKADENYEPWILGQASG